MVSRKQILPICSAVVELNQRREERVQDGDLSIKTVLTAKICADVGTIPVSDSVFPQQIGNIFVVLTIEPTSEVQNIKLKQTSVGIGCGHRDVCKTE